MSEESPEEAPRHVDGGVVQLGITVKALAEMGLDDHPEHIPDLQNLDNLQSVNLALNVLVGNYPASFRGQWSRLWLISFVRLMDKAIKEWTSARSEALRFADAYPSNLITPYYRAVDHFENSINALYRCWSHAEQLSVVGTAPEDLTFLRNAIEHSASRIETQYEDRPYMAYLHLRQTGVEIQDSFVEYSRLCELVRFLYRHLIRVSTEGIPSAQ